MNFHNLVIRALIGALIGGTIGFALVCLIVVVIFFDSRLMTESLLIFGSGGLIGGALYGLFLGIVEEKRAGVVIGGLIGGIIGCAFAGFGLLIYEGTPQPSPQPYPGFKTYTSSSSGSQASSRVQTYTAALSLDTLQQYYEDELDQYCADDWEFQNFSNTEDQPCLFADCKIPRLWYKQFFEVNLCSISETQTLIHHTDIWDSH